MNLVDMARRRDCQLLLRAGLVYTGTERWRAARRLATYVTGDYIVAVKRTVDGIDYHGFELSVDERTALVLRTPLAWHPFRLKPATTGWSLLALDRRAVGKRFEIVLKNRTTNEDVTSRFVELTEAPQAVEFPIPPADNVEPRDIDLEMRFPGGRGGRAFLAIHRMLDRRDIIGLCRGTGVELGPGLHPQVMPDETRDVTYVEQASPEEWDRLYNERARLQVDKTLWQRYTIGEAFPLPAEDGSLDFIFSSHVFEHLANPLGHLLHWYGKLRTGGVVTGVVPDVGGSKDYVFEPCSLRDILDEFALGEMQPQLMHYRRWAAVRAPGKDPAWYWQSKRSIHVHFYTGDSMRALLEVAVAKIGFAWFQVWHTPNHKDFYFAIGK